jgi:hypothetical protein
MPILKCVFCKSDVPQYYPHYPPQNQNICGKCVCDDIKCIHRDDIADMGIMKKQIDYLIQSRQVSFGYNDISIC